MSQASKGSEVTTEREYWVLSAGLDELKEHAGVVKYEANNHLRRGKC